MSELKLLLQSSEDEGLTSDLAQELSRVAEVDVATLPKARGAEMIEVLVTAVGILSATANVFTIADALMRLKGKAESSKARVSGTLRIGSKLVMQLDKFDRDALVKMLQSAG